MLIKQTRTYTQDVEGHARNRNPFADVIRKQFNALAMAHVRAGGKATPMMNADGIIQNFKVTALTETHAILEDSKGETYAMVWES